MTPRWLPPLSQRGNFFLSCRNCGNRLPLEAFLTLLDGKEPGATSLFCWSCDSRDWLPIRSDGKRECPVCTNHFKPTKGAPHPVVAHWDDQRSRWCPGGVQVDAPPPKRSASLRPSGFRR